MTVQSLFQQTGINIQVSKSLAQGGAALFTTDERLTAYTHEIKSEGGFFSAKIDLSVRESELEQWIDEGLGRDLRIVDARGGTIFECFVDSLSANLGTLAIQRGPLLDIANRVSLTYSTIDTSVTPPVTGLRVTTPAADDLVSQVKYGVIQKNLSAGGVNAANALIIRDTFLAENAYPKTEQTLALPPRDYGSLSLNCLGYYHWLKTYSYNSTTTGLINASTRIAQIIAASPNAFFSASVAKIATNALTVPAYDNNDRIAQAVISGIVQDGDPSFNRWIFGIYEGRIPWYQMKPSTAIYEHHLTDEMPVIMRGQNAQNPESLRPGQWIFIADYLPGRTRSSSLLLDPRNVFIETVRFTAPGTLQIQSQRSSVLSQMLAQYGLSGIGA